jgi:hypothetical protein
MTYIDLINTVLRRLREDSIDTAASWSGSLISSNILSDYQIMIGDIVNEAKREVEDAWNWSILRASPTIATVNGTQAYNIPGTNERSKILMAQEQSNGYVMQEMSDRYLQFTKYPTASVQFGTPDYYSVTGIDPATNEIIVEFDTVPNAAYNITFRVVNPQNDLSLATDVIRVPHQPVMLGALARAIAERGEDGGSMSDMVAMQYQNALADAIQLDAGRTVGEVDFYAS